MRILLVLVATWLTQAQAEETGKKTGRLSVEPNLENWMNTRAIHLKESGPLSQARLQGLDQLSLDYLSLKGLIPNKPREATIQQAKDVAERLSKHMDEHSGEAHPLHHYIISELGSVADLKQKLSELKQNYPFNSCLQRNEFAMRSENASLYKGKALEPQKWLAELDSFRSNSFKKRQLRKFLEKKTKIEQEKMTEFLIPLAQKYTWVEEVAPWLSVPSGSDTLDVANLLRKNDCDGAKVKFLSGLSAGNTTDQKLMKSIESAAEIGRCFRKSGVDARVAALSEFLPVMEQKFGFRGTVRLTVEIARAYWAGDRHADAREVLAQIFSQGLGQEKIDELGPVQLILAQIYENEDRTEEAILNFEHLVNYYKDQDLKMEGLKSLVLLYSEKQEWVRAAEAAQRIIAGQDLLTEDKREVNRSGFALFWGGRAWLAMGEKELANAAWKRLKSEYYSTYYGAIGHFLLEESFGQVFDVEMSNDIAFDASKHLTGAFEKNDHARIAAIDVFLRGGLEREADCEIDELAVLKSSDRDYARALLYYAAGSWLKSVKLFDELPRVYRHGLPRGSERILFPVRYKETIENFAMRLNLDPDFVIGLIRQESLFDRRALSPVGAMGLMQIMETTAQLEMKKINGAYLSEAQDKQAIVDLSVDRLRLFEADTNLMVGIHHVNTLMKKYGSPVFTLSAYNAGPGAMLRWKQRFAPSDLLLFVEKIPYKETNNYVKLILRNYFYYKKWYRDSTLSMPHLETVASPLVNNPAKSSGVPNVEDSANF